MTRFPYTDFLCAKSRAKSLAEARKLFDDVGGVIYDDSRAFIVVCRDDTMISEGVRVSGDTLSADEVSVILTRMTDKGYDFYSPITQDILLSWAAAIADEN